MHPGDKLHVKHSWPKSHTGHVVSLSGHHTRRDTMSLRPSLAMSVLITDKDVVRFLHCTLPIFSKRNTAGHSDSVLGRKRILFIMV